MCRVFSRCTIDVPLVFFGRVLFVCCGCVGCSVGVISLCAVGVSGGQLVRSVCVL